MDDGNYDYSKLKKKAMRKTTECFYHAYGN